MVVAEKEIGLEHLLKKRDTLIIVAGSLEEFYALGEQKADFIQGYIYIQMGASVTHERLYSKIFLQLGLFIVQNQLGEIFGSRLSVGITDDYHPEPDIFFVGKDNPGKYVNDRFDGIPDLVIEIISPSTRKLDLDEKRPLYQKHRVPEVYFVDAAKKLVMIDVLEDGDYVSLSLRDGTFASRVLPGLTWEIEKMYNG
ncbi:MAG: Uma2 family endonuclease [Cytophagales bacterium]|jgi:Uma2 family endonuclease|nr:Uma2 family endonuclease [Cytophagales bacterium]